MENQEKIGFFKRIGIAMTNPKDYHKIAKQSAGKSIGIYFIISIIYAIVIMSVLFFFCKTFSLMAKEYITNLPEFSISKNGFIAQMEKPIQFYDNTSGALIYIDSNTTLEEIKNINVDKIYSSNAYVLIGTDAFSVKSTEDIISMTFIELFEKDEMNDSQNEYLQQSDIETDQIHGEQIINENDFNLNNEQILPNIEENIQNEEYEFNNNTILDIFKTIEESNILLIAFAITSVIVLIYMFVSFLIIGLIYIILALIICSIYKKKLSFKELYNVSMYSNITTTLLALLMLFVNFPYWGILRLVIIVIYMQIAIKNYEDGQNKVNTLKDDNNNQ